MLIKHCIAFVLGFWFELVDFDERDSVGRSVPLIMLFGEVVTVWLRRLDELFVDLGKEANELGSVTF